MKTIGIVCDNYKVKKYRKKLEKSGYKIDKQWTFTKDTTGFHIIVKDEDFGKEKRKIQKICEELEFFFKHRN